MVRAPCCERMGLNRGAWTPAEDQILVAFILRYGHGNWRALPKQAGLLRCGKSCRLRWANYLRPDIKRGNFSKEEEDAIIKLHEQLGNRWSAIAARLPGRTDNEIKNVWHTTLKKRIMKPNPADKEPNKSYEAQSQPTTLKLKASAAAHQSYEGPGLVPAFPPLTCSDLSSSETDSSSVGRENNTDTAINEEYAVSSGELMEMDENFWSEVSSLVTGSEVLPFSSIEDAGFANSPGSGDEMDFWRRVLMESGEFWPSCLLSD